MLIFEDLKSVPRRRLFALMGSQWSVTPTAWLSVPFFLGLGLTVELARGSGRETITRVASGMIAGMVIGAVTILHSLGHTIAARWVRAPESTVLVTATFHVCQHRCGVAPCSRWAHVGRALGGPLANLAAGAAAAAACGGFSAGWLGFFAAVNVVIAVFTLLPIPSIDGWVIWGELIGFRRRGA